MPTKVTGVYPQPEKKKSTKIKFFPDGRVVKCCDEHLWSIYNQSDGSKRILHTDSLEG